MCFDLVLLVFKFIDGSFFELLNCSSLELVFCEAVMVLISMMKRFYLAMRYFCFCFQYLSQSMASLESVLNPEGVSMFEERKSSSARGESEICFKLES